MKKIILAVVTFAPTLALAQTLGNFTTLVGAVRGIINTLIPMAFAVALLVFFWGLAKFILSAGNEDAKETGKRIMIWGIVALFVMASVWGIVAFIGSALGIGQGQNIDNVPGVTDTTAGA
jgi:hypothetical protein